jgi:hypothetical protein
VESVGRYFIYLCSMTSQFRMIITVKNVTCYNQMVVAIVDELTSFNFFPRSIQSVIFFSTFLLLRCYILSSMFIVIIVIIFVSFILFVFILSIIVTF